MNQNSNSTATGLLESAKAMIGFHSPPVSPIKEANEDYDELGADNCQDEEYEEDDQPPTVNDIINQLDTLIDLDLE